VDFLSKNIAVFGVNDRDQESARAWVEREGLPFPILLDRDRSIAMAYGMSRAGDERYLADPSGGKRPAVVIDAEGVVLKLLPDLATVEGQRDALASLA
jgi:peroxiredoxin